VKLKDLCLKYSISKKKMIKLKKLLNEVKKYDIGSGWMGNGLTIWNRAEQQDDDYKIIAHISDNGTLSIRDKQLPSDIKKMFQIWADSMKKGNRPGTY
jgi:predicted RNA-binding protein (virulence factor B family)